MAVIDFDKIKAKESPSKKAKVNISGTIVELDIYPLTGMARMEYWSLDHQDQADERVRKRVILALTNGAKLSEYEAMQLISLDWSAALDLSGAIYQFTIDFELELEKVKAEAEKNFQKASGTDTQV